MKSSFKLKFPLLFLFFAIMLTCIFSGYTVDAAPFWLKEGAYAHYEFNGSITLRNITTVWHPSGIYCWECVEVAGYTATLEVTINVSGLVLMGVDDKGKPKWGEWRVQEKFDVNINVETCEAYIGNESVGILPYWMSTDVEEGEPISNFTSYDNLTLSAVIYGVMFSVETPYRVFEGDELWNVATESITLVGAQIHGNLYYEKESGLLISGRFVDNIWFQRAMARTIWGPGNGAQPFNLKETNIQFRPEPPSLVGLVLPYIVTGLAAIAAVGIILVYAIKIRKKNLKR